MKITAIRCNTSLPSTYSIIYLLNGSLAFWSKENPQPRFWRLFHLGNFYLVKKLKINLKSESLLPKGQVNIERWKESHNASCVIFGQLSWKRPAWCCVVTQLNQSRFYNWYIFNELNWSICFCMSAISFCTNI